jgi:hypothetical protein
MSVQRIESWDSLAAGLGETIGSETDYRVLKDQFERGESYGYLFNGVTFVLLRPEFPELVVCCMKGAGLVEAVREIFAAAKAKGFRTVRAHTARPAMLRMIRRLDEGANIREYVLEVELT